MQKQKKTHGDQYMKLFMIHFFQKNIPPEFLDKYKNNPNEPQLLPSGVKVALKNGHGTSFIFTSVDDIPKGFW